MIVRPIAYSIFNLILAAQQQTMRGIERVDLGYVSYLFENWPADCYGVFPTALGLRLFSRSQVLSGRDQLIKMWRENEEGIIDPAFRWLKATYALESQPNPAIRIERKSRKFQGYWRIAQLLLRDGIHFGLPLSALPPDSLYIDIGHNGLATPIMHKWLISRPDVKPVFMVHDAIPLEFPELVSPRNVLIHTKILATTAAHARAVIVPTASAGRSIQSELANLGDLSIPIHPINLPIENAFRTNVAAIDGFASHPYFLVCGAFEGRKNPMLLLNIWRRLISKFGVYAPRLIFAGSPGHASSDAIDQIRRSRILRDHVFLVSGLSTSAVASLMVGARALLMPSFAEGFGLPTVEALALGTPVILSDIPAHRDAVGNLGLFVEPTDGAGWQNQIERLLNDSEYYAALRERITHFKPNRWPDYMREVSNLLMNL